jgi:3-oxoacyl-[acyl-carrier protein] reductase/7-alpha-hydroxysteroid dehydrogenase
MYSFKNKTVIITGASKGIGAEIATSLANKGANVVINYNKDQENAHKVAANIHKNNGTALCIKADVTNSNDVKSLFQQTKTEFGSIDAVVNNAGVYQFEPIENVTEKEFHRQINSNVLSVILTTQEALNYFTAGGKIINISSIATKKPSPMTVLYTATKCAVDGITKTLAKELASRNILVNAILPGPTQTEGNQIIGSEMEGYVVSNTPLGRIGQPKDISGLVTFLISEEANWITGQTIGVSGGFE